MAPGMMITKNMPNVSHWSLESGYANEMSDGEYPIRAVDSGKNAAFDVVLTLLKRNFDFHCKGFDQGFRVILSMPGEELKATLNSLRVPISENSLITIKPKWITTSDGLRSYRPNQRQCFYQNERRLRFFKMYTQTNCEEECLSNFTKLECGCVKFSMPRDVYTTICGTANINCYETAMRKLSTDDSPESFSATCNCIPACTSIEYSTSIDHIKFDAAAINKIPGYKSNDSEYESYLN
ncbi:pickpocket protein 28-like [Sitodiplosis mosellana]|uniref:pickpocket protein 28-like n=1 Tax=Sitodiplosis mosellana TaxID=263140 RepID=UPI00244470A6|nr:pickpocket protein 28-like [Sitodiplosis mosellana]